MHVNFRIDILISISKLKTQGAMFFNINNY